MAENNRPAQSRDPFDRFDEAMLAQRLDAWFSRHFESHDARLHNALGMHPE